VNVAAARLRGLEVSAASPPGKRLRARLVYAYGFAQARGAVTGGLGDLEPRADAGYYFLDHDQRHTSVASIDWTITPRSWVHFAVKYGSGFLREDGPDHLPSHVTADMAVGLSERSHWSAALEVENLTNQQYLINLSSEFNGTHVARPRSVGARLRLSF
jgi:outer membrane receptor protein involved in Fe transport